MVLHILYLTFNIGAGVNCNLFAQISTDDEHTP